MAARLLLASQPAEEAQSGVLLATQPVIQLVDVAGQPVAQRGVLVSALVLNGEATLSGLTAVRTDSDGQASFTDLILSGPVGFRTLRFTASGLSAVQSDPIELKAGLPATMTLAAGNNLTGRIGRELSVPPAVRVSDAAGNPVSGVEVIFTVTGGGGLVTGGTQRTGADGVATLTAWTLGSQPGINTLTATSPALAGASVVFTATAVVVNPIQIISGNSQQGFAEDTLEQIVVLVRDEAATPLPGALVSFEVTVGGGSFSPATATTDANGLAQTKWVLGSAIGTQEASVTSPAAGPAKLTATADAWKQIAPGWRHSCGLAESGKAYCWGDNDFNQLGIGTPPSSSVLNPVPVSGGLSFTTLQASAGGNFSCGIVVDGSGYCWGSNVNGQRGDGTPPQGIGNSTRFPTQLGGGFSWQQISVGGDHACGITLTGETYCWGNNGSGSLGDGTTTSRIAPTLVTGGLLFKWIAAGRAHTCGITATDQVYCWGQSIAFKSGSNSNVLVPTLVPTSVVFAMLSSGWISTCGLSTTGGAYCWGSNGSGQIGDGTFSARATPTAVAGGFTWVTLEMRGQTGCGITTTGNSYCWGYNDGGELGNGTQTKSNIPVPIAGPAFSTFTAIQSGGEVGCGLIGTRPRCWGSNKSGQVGDGTKEMRTVPTPVRFP
ncbi:MAG TPA: hypothetical protein VGQ69_13540 [Gemmatimonadales bacterium]|nr:hypothetical protein [Gemmatimonadales bacterium]